MRLSRKGFTLVELLAVVVILGIIMTVSIPAVTKWINRSKDESKESQKQTLLMAGQAYAQGNSRVLPKKIGETKLLSAVDLKKSNYLKDNLVDSDKKDCMKDSFVRIYKYDKNGYTYTAYLYCEGEEVPDNITGVPTDIDISFGGDNITVSGENQNIEDVTLSSFRTVIKGSKDDSTLGVDGYSYSISVKYNGTGEFVEIFHSGSLNGGGRPKVVIEKQLSEYTNITTVSEFLVTVEAYNRDGGYHKETKSSKYGDSTPPKCGDIIGQAGEDEWFKENHVSHITVKCIEEKNGSGCVKNEFTKSFNTEMINGTITISDNAGNTRDCTVRVHHDWTYPTLVVVAYKRNRDGTKGTQVATITANNTNRSVNLNSYANSVGSNHWLNNANYLHGVYYEITASDNIKIDKGQWYYNASGISSFSASNLNTMNTGSSKMFTKTDNKTNTYLSAEGIRRAKYEVRDKAGNITVVNIEANIDITPPQCTSSGGNASWTAGERTLTGTCSDTTSKCAGNASKPYNQDINSTVESPGVVYDNANNGTTCPANQTVRIDKTNPSCTVTKTLINSPNGVSATFTCSDGGSGVKTCPSGKSGLKSNSSYSVVDNVGNIGSCTVGVTVQDQSRVRPCSTYNRGSACGCEKRNSCPSSDCGYGKWSCSYVSGCSNGLSSCGSAASYGTYCCKEYIGDECTFFPCYTQCNRSLLSCVNSSCSCAVWKACADAGCASWGSYSDWANVASCTESSDNSAIVQCRLIYY